MKCLWIAVLAMGAALNGRAQSIAIPAGDPDVFAAFLRMHHAIVTSTGQTGATSEEAGKPALAATKGWQRDLGIADADFAKIELSYAALRAQLDALDREVSAYVSAHPGNADSAALTSFLDRRAATISAAAAALRRQLSAAGATALFGFIDGPFRAACTRVPIGKAN